MSQKANALAQTYFNFASPSTQNQTNNANANAARAAAPNRPAVPALTLTRPPGAVIDVGAGLPRDQASAARQRERDEKKEKNPFIERFTIEQKQGIVYSIYNDARTNFSSANGDDDNNNNKQQCVTLDPKKIVSRKLPYYTLQLKDGDKFECVEHDPAVVQNQAGGIRQRDE